MAIKTLELWTIPDINNDLTKQGVERYFYNNEQTAKQAYETRYKHTCVSPIPTPNKITIHVVDHINDIETHKKHKEAQELVDRLDIHKASLVYDLLKKDFG